MLKVNYQSIAETVMAQVRGKGAFLTVQARDRTNTMTIGWATIGFVWGRPIMTVAVRNSRYTHTIIEHAVDFTVSVPMTDLAQALEFCGAHSGRAGDKYKQCGLELFPAVATHTPIIKLAGYHYECRIVYKSAMDPKNLIEEYERLYPQKDYHTLYYGEIMECYSTMDEAEGG